MKLPFLKKKKEKAQAEGEILLALDIGTEFVKAVLFTADKTTQEVHIKGFGRVKQHGNAMQGAMIINIENVVHTCDRAIGKALQNADKVAVARNRMRGGSVQTQIPKSAIVGIAGELVQGITIVADYNREGPDDKIDKDETDEVVKRIKEQAFKDAVVDISEEIGVDPNSLEEINTKINSTYIDGLKVDNPIGFTGKEVSYKVFSTFAPKIHLNSLRDILKQLKLHVLSIEVEPYTISRAIKGGRAENYSAVIIDIGGGTTDVALVDNGSIIGTKMFAYGGRVFTKRISKDLNIGFAEAEELKLKYSDQKLGKKMETNIKKALAKDVEIWAEGVELALEELEDVDTYPTTFFLCGGGSALPEIKQALIEYPWLQSLAFLKYPDVKYLFPNQLEDIFDETKLAISPEDVAPIALARMIFELN